MVHTVIRILHVDSNSLDHIKVMSVLHFLLLFSNYRFVNVLDVFVKYTKRMNMQFK